MATNRSYTIIGLFLLGAVVLAVVAVLVFGGTRILSNNRQAIIFFDQSVLGLSQGSKVLFRGVQVGTVKNVQLRLDSEAGRARIGVTVEINGNNTVMMDGAPSGDDVTTEELVERGLRAQLVVWSYVTSQLAVNLDFQPGTEAKRVASNDALDLPEIPAVPSEIEQLKDTVSGLPWKDTLETVNQTMEATIRLADDMDALITTLGPNLERTTATARETMESARRVMENSNSQIEQTLASVRELSENLNQQIDSRDAQFDRLLENAEQTSRNLNQLSRNLEGLTDPRSDTRMDLQSTLRDLSAGASSLRRFAETLERDPNALLFGGDR
ncbi:paraquat-inducible protein B [Salinisphaera orenii MK-B5]|uniref:Paraquat-inducible protein B n=2 Tax=Salinisphaera orenii TaxID=856731 RepID=A0A423PQ78_9GAMM|nr:MULTISPECIES: MlaD family protein [Salinisphaera]ROO27759.1 paraquat-inducible protein B [Salinisphaera orenii MK-B5]ROO30234.1 paraquat-inducible protein B [Salinisphaera halophila YIM 95161]